MITPQAGQDVPVAASIASARRWMVGQGVLYVVLAAVVGYLVTAQTEAPDGLLLTVTGLVLVNGLLGVTLLCCAGMLEQRRKATWCTVMGAEIALVCVLLTVAVVALTSEHSGAGPAPAGMLFFAMLMRGVLTPLGRPEVREAFGLRPGAARR